MRYKLLFEKQDLGDDHPPEYEVLEVCGSLITTKAYIYVTTFGKYRIEVTPDRGPSESVSFGASQLRALTKKLDVLQKRFDKKVKQGKYFLTKEDL